MKHDPRIDLLHDGELDPETAREVEARLSAFPADRARLERLELIGGLLRELDLAAGMPSDLTDRIVHATEARRSVRARYWVAAAGLLAAAAAVFVAVSREPIPEGPDEGALLAANTLAEAPPVSIESVDFGGTAGAIFMVSAGVTDTMVVWTLDTDSTSGLE
ncbi:MAG TPA: hypothetical protein VKY73_13300 [Polyangiaceae bacterium]|nr:hypothetical protein [Polyangiaceae bacterium]